MVVVLLMSGCAHVNLPSGYVFVPHTEPIAHVGVNGLYGGALPAATLAHLDQLGPITLRATVRDKAEAQAALDSVQDYPRLSVLLLIGEADLELVSNIATLSSTQWVGIELGNELDLAGLSAVDFGRFVQLSVQILRDAGYRGDVISGGIYTVDDGTLGYLQQAMMAMPADVILGLHWYGDANQGLLAKVQQLAGARRIAVTEFGMPSTDAAMDAAQQVYLAGQMATFKRLGASYAIVYQLVSGPTASALDNFGVQRFDGTWKPGASVLVQ